VNNNNAARIRPCEVKLAMNPDIQREIARQTVQLTDMSVERSQPEKIVSNDSMETQLTSRSPESNSLSKTNTDSAHDSVKRQKNPRQPAGPRIVVTRSQRPSQDEINSVVQAQ
jgi:hypothetical protein